MYFSRVLKGGENLIFDGPIVEGRQFRGIEVRSIVLTPSSDGPVTLRIEHDGCAEQEKIELTLTKDERCRFLSNVSFTLQKGKISFKSFGFGTLHISGYLRSDDLEKTISNQNQIYNISEEDLLEVMEQKFQTNSLRKNKKIHSPQPVNIRTAQHKSPSYLPFKIPSIGKKNPKQNIIIGIIDASGSMSKVWKDMVQFWNQCIAPKARFLITFHDTPHESLSTYLLPDLKMHGGGSTNILLAFKQLEKILQSILGYVSFTIIFISDGEDNRNRNLIEEMSKLKGGQGRNITMLCLGVGNSFPTRTALKIRELYHTGDLCIPAIFLIQYAGKTAFFNKFQTISQYFTQTQSVKIINAKEAKLKESPWEEQISDNLRQGKWILVHKSVKELNILYSEKEERVIPVMTVTNLNLEDLVNCFRGWSQRIQLLSIEQNTSFQKLLKIAQVTVDYMTKCTYHFEEMNQIYILRKKPLGLKRSVKSRMLDILARNVGIRIKWFIDELSIIGDEFALAQLDNFEAAKRIGLGTITGKYHQKALALKSITLKDFEDIKKEFSIIFQKTKLSEKPSLQEASIISLQNQKQIFQQHNFLEGIKLCKSQYDLVQIFPVVGYSLKVRRFDGSMINPWKVRVIQLAKTHKAIDSAQLANNNNKYELSIGQGRVEQINAVLPLFGQEDIQMAPLFNTRLFRLTVSFMVVQNIDTYHDQAYMALLASTFVFLLKEPQSEWRDDFFNKIYASMKVTYWQIATFRSFIEKSLDNPHILFNSNEEQDHTDITKVMLLVFFIDRQKLLSPDRMRHFVDLVMVHYTQKTYIENNFKMAKVAKVSIKIDENTPFQFAKTEHNTILNFAHLQKTINQHILQIINSDGFDITLSDRIFLHKNDQKRVTSEHIRGYYRLLRKRKLNNSKFLCYFGHALKGRDPIVYNTPVSRDLGEVKSEIKKLINMESLSPSNGNKLKLVRKFIEDKYIELFRQTHYNLMPLTEETFNFLCKDKGVNKNGLILSQESGLTTNACMSKKCKYYLQKMAPQELSEHLKLWRKTMPQQFHSTVMEQLDNNKSVGQIYRGLIKSGRVNLKKHRKTEEEIKQYIAEIKKQLL